MNNLKSLQLFIVGLIVVGCSGSSTHANETRSKISSLVSGLVQMSADIGFFPDEDSGLNLLIENELELDSWNGAYITLQGLYDSWGNKFIYKFDSSKNEYYIYSMGANGVDDLGRGDDIYCDSFCPNPESSGHKLKWTEEA